MKRIVFLIVVLLPSCAAVDRALEDLRAPVEPVGAVVEAIAAAWIDADLNDDGYISGASEWTAFLTRLVAGIRKARQDPVS